MSKSITFYLFFCFLLYLGCKSAVAQISDPATTNESESSDLVTIDSSTANSSVSTTVETSDPGTSDSSTGETEETFASTSRSDSTTANDPTQESGGTPIITSASDSTPAGETEETSADTSNSDSTLSDSTTTSDSTVAPNTSTEEVSESSSTSISESNNPTKETDETKPITPTSESISPDTTSTSASASESNNPTGETGETSPSTSTSESISTDTSESDTPTESESTSSDTTSSSASTSESEIPTKETDTSSSSTSTSVSTSSVAASTSTSTPDATTTITPTTTTASPPRPLTTSIKWSDSDIAEDCSIVVQVDDGYHISVTVSGVVLPDGSHLLIEGGESHDPESTDGRVFANTVKGPKKYLFKTTMVFATCEVDTSQDFKFNVLFEREGELTTTVTTSTTTEISWPSTEPGDSVYIMVNVSGKYLKDYTEEVQEKFKSAVRCMAEVYLQTDITINHENINITNANVIITTIRQCPYSWPKSATCVQIEFKLPIIYNDPNWDGYMFTTEHLRRMWLKHADGCLANDFSVYDDPDFDKSIMIWAIGISVVIACFIVLLWFLRIFSSRIKRPPLRRNRKNSDTMSIISSRKESLLSMTPHYLQEHMDTPKFFET